MSNRIDQRLITQFSDSVHIKAQQMMSRLMPMVEVKMIRGDDYAYDSYGQVESVEANGRNPVIQHSEQSWERRQLSRNRFYVSKLVDEKDVDAMMTDPNSTLVDAMVMEMMRRKDKVIYDSLLADIKVGRNFETTVTASADGVRTVDATAGLTYDKLLEIKQNFINNEVGNDMDVSMMLGITGREHTQLMNINQLTNGDFIRTLPVDDGSMEVALGMQLVKFGGSVSGSTFNNPIIAENSPSAGQRSCFAVANNGVCLGISSDMKVAIKDRDDMLETSQITVSMTIGAVRTEGKLVQQVTTTI